MKRRVSFPHQVHGCEKAVGSLLSATYVNDTSQHKLARAFLLYDDPGLGKTRQALDIGHAIVDYPGGEGKGVLIVAPAACMSVWEKEIETDYSHRFKDVRVYQGHLTKKKITRKPIERNTVVIISYTSLLSLCKQHIRKHLEIGTMCNEDLEQYCLINDQSVAFLKNSLRGADYRRELLRYTRELYRLPKVGSKKDSVWDKFFEQQPWRILIMDEIHKVKGAHNETTKAIGFIRASYRLGLSGTPIVNHPTDLFSILKFGLGLFDLQWNTILKDTNGEYWKELMNAISLGRKKSEITELQQILPKRQKQDEEKLIEWTHLEQKKEYIKVKQESINIYRQMTNQKDKTLRQTFMGKTQQLRQICLHVDLPKYMIDENYIPISFKMARNWKPATHKCFEQDQRMRIYSLLCILKRYKIPVNLDLKYKMIKTLIEQDLRMIQPSCKMRYVHRYLTDHPNEKIVCFSTYRVFLESIMSPWLHSIGIECVLFSGKSKQKQKLALQRFDEDPDVKVLLVVKACGGEGLNLQKSARACFIMDPHFNSATDEQAAQRIDRIGQNQEVYVFKLFMTGSIDEALRQLQHRKEENINAWTMNKSNKSLEEQGLFLDKYDTVKI